MGLSRVLLLLLATSAATSHALQRRGCSNDLWEFALDEYAGAASFRSSWLKTPVTATASIPTVLSVFGSQGIVSDTITATTTATATSSVTVVSNVTLPASTLTATTTATAISSVTIVSNVTLPASTLTSVTTATQTQTQTQNGTITETATETQTQTQTQTQTTTQTATLTQTQTNTQTVTQTTTSTAICQTGVNAVGDPGFEQGLYNVSPWVYKQGEVRESGDNPAPHSGSYYWGAFLPEGGEEGYTTSTISQTIHTCGTGKYTISFWWNQLGSFCSGSAIFAGQELGTFGGARESDAWVLASYTYTAAATALSLETVTLELTATNTTDFGCDGFGFDDVSVIAT